MPWQHIRISRFGGPEVLELAEQPTLPEPRADEVRIKVLAAGTGLPIPSFGVDAIRTSKADCRSHQATTS